MTEKYKLQQEDINSMDLNGDTLAKLKQILPEVFAEGADGKPSIDVERLKIARGGAVDIEADDKTRFSFNWSGKKQAQALANQPSTATLRPSLDDSKNWDNTQNIYIEGDNLEVLKLLQKSYYGQIKMIYIDPPYNTGKDFVYKDNFHNNVKNYLQLTGQVDDEGNKISTNTDKSGRYHTDWLNMMYPRLKLARNLLKDDGVIFISIDDNEVHNLRKMCDEIFSEDNFIAQYIHKNNSNKNQAKLVSISTEYFLCYAKQKDNLNNHEWRLKKHGSSDIVKVFRKLKHEGLSLTEIENEIKNMYKRPKYSHLSRWNKVDENGVFKDADLSREGGAKNYTIINPFTKQACVVPNRGWGKSLEELQKLQELDLIWYGDESTAPGLKDYIEDDDVTVPDSFWYYDNSVDTRWIKETFGELIFEFPKPVNMIKNVIGMMPLSIDDIILDFFSGSATTAHAVMQLNAEDGGKRKYICVQLPELTYDLDNEGNEIPKKDSVEAYKVGYKNICEIGKERIRRAGEKVLTEWTEKQQKTNNENDLLSQDGNSAPITAPDIGFRVFKLDTSNIKPFDSNDIFANDLLVDGRSALDLFYELVLKQGYSLDNRQSILDIGGTRCYALVHEDNTPFVLAVLDDTVKPNFALEILKYTLTLVIVKDDCFGTDEIKLNLLATLEQLQNKDNPLQIRIV